MKTFLIIAILLCLWAGKAQAGIEFLYTGLSASEFDGPNNGWVPYNNSPYIGGPAANNWYASAFQFNLEESTNISNLLFSGYSYGFPETKSEFNLKIYKGNLDASYLLAQGLVPNYNNLVQSTTVQLTGEENQTTVWDNYNIPFEASLDSGNYWISQERNGFQGSMIIYDPNINYNAIHTPEPSTWALFAIGICGLLFRRKLVRI